MARLKSQLKVLANELQNPVLQVFSLTSVLNLILGKETLV